MQNLIKIYKVVQEFLAFSLTANERTDRKTHTVIGLKTIFYSILSIVNIYTMLCVTGSDSTRKAYIKVISCYTVIIVHTCGSCNHYWF